MSDLFAVGLGFEFAGALALVRGFLTSPREFAVGTARAGNTFSWFNVRAAEDSVDSLVGVVSIAVGFFVQAVAYILQIGGAGPRSTGGERAYLVAALAVFGTAVLAYAIARAVRWPLLRRHLVEVAHYAREERRDLPDADELFTYGKILDRVEADENPVSHALRVWRVQDVRRRGDE